MNTNTKQQNVLLLLFLPRLQPLCVVSVSTSVAFKPFALPYHTYFGFCAVSMARILLALIALQRRSSRFRNFFLIAMNSLRGIAFVLALVDRTGCEDFLF